MSPARCLCAMPVNSVCAHVLTSRELWRPASVKLVNWIMPVVGFDPTSSPLWADNQPSVGPLRVDGGEGWGFRRSSAELHRLVYRHLIGLLMCRCIPVLWSCLISIFCRCRENWRSPQKTHETWYGVKKENRKSKIENRKSKIENKKLLKKVLVCCGGVCLGVWMAYTSTSTSVRVCSFQTPTKSPVSAQYA